MCVTVVCVTVVCVAVALLLGRSGDSTLNEATEAVFIAFRLNDTTHFVKLSRTNFGGRGHVEVKTCDTWM